MHNVDALAFDASWARTCASSVTSVQHFVADAVPPAQYERTCATMTVMLQRPCSAWHLRLAISDYGRLSVMLQTASSAERCSSSLSISADATDDSAIARLTPLKARDRE
jgi:hypothetical protein